MIAELQRVKNVWPEVRDVLSVPRTKSQYKKLVDILDELLDEVGENEKHPYYPLLDTIGSLIHEYEKQQEMDLPSDPIQVLKYLINEHSLSQKDLSFIGSQGVVSEILNGKRSLNVRQIRLLSERFHVSASVFI
ncbi:MAG: transcriptional regulator [Leptospiraceae bacterium]|nr:transcriptional regulator [Leptospiraceae bacterium]